MKTLILARHAQAAPAPELEDRDRPLTVTGVKRAYKAGNLLHQQGWGPTRWLSSPADRALHTAVIFSKIFHATASLHIEERLYTFSMDQLESIIRESDPGFENVILFGHNTAITDFVNTFSSLPVENVPTSGVVVLTFDTDHWSEIQIGTLRTFIQPKKL